MSNSVHQREPNAPSGLMGRGSVLEMTWGVKESFRTYFERLSDHAYDLTGGVNRAPNGEFRFPQREKGDRAADGYGIYAFAGSVTLTAHFGALSVMIADPKILVDPDGRATLSAAVDEVNGVPVRMVIAELARDYKESAGSHEASQVTFSASLAAEGQYLFMGNYYAGDPMDPVIIRFTHAPA